jgi:Fe-S-cluster containining protein
MKKFVCRQCGTCCAGTSTISLAPHEIERISKFLGVSREEFLKKFTVLKKPNRIEMKTENGYCIFLDQKTGLCKIHPVKPDICKKWPFIPALFDKENFEIIKSFCKGLEDFTWEDVLEIKKHMEKYREWTEVS